jgi:tyramine---L-glutamate ligase
MRIGLFEWICGGGMHALEVNSIPPGLLREGWAMLSTLVHLFSTAGTEVSTIIDRRLADLQGWEEIANHRALNLEISRQLGRDATLPFLEHWKIGSPDTIEPSGNLANQIPPPSELAAEEPKSFHNQPPSAVIEAWIDAAGECDVTLVIAPEIDGLLQSCLTSLTRAGIQVLNCSGNVLANSCDKWLTADCFIRHGLPHPPTWKASQHRQIPFSAAPQWCCKSRFGAGCEETVIGSASQIEKQCRDLRNPNWYIVQPWLEGESYSCSAIVDRGGIAHWLPLTTQQFQTIRFENGLSSLQYQGGRVASETTGLDRPVRLLNRTLDSLSDGKPSKCIGWIGIDLLKSVEAEWIIIECNPRITTSLVGLSQQSPVNLASVLLEGWSGLIKTSLSGSWLEGQFQVP